MFQFDSASKHKQTGFIPKQKELSEIIALVTNFLFLTYLIVCIFSFQPNFPNFDQRWTWILIWTVKQTMLMNKRTTTIKRVVVAAHQTIVEMQLVMVQLPMEVVELVVVEVELVVVEMQLVVVETQLVGNQQTQSIQTIQVILHHQQLVIH